MTALIVTDPETGCRSRITCVMGFCRGSPDRDLTFELCSLILQNKRLLYDLLFRTSAASLLELARDPKHLGADIGFLGVLHTWGQNLQIHPHVHYIVPAGGLALDGSRWIDSSRRFFLPVKALSHRFTKSSVSNSVNCSNKTDFTSTLHFSNLPRLAPSATFSGNLAKRTGSSTRSHPSAVPNRFSTTWPATPIASPSPIIASWPSRTIASPSAGETMPMAARTES